MTLSLEIESDFNKVGFKHKMTEIGQNMLKKLIIFSK